MIAKSRLLSANSIAAAFSFSLLASLAIPAQAVMQNRQSAKLPHYTVTDLGTLGGTFSDVVGINSRGEEAGTSTLPGDQVRHAALWRNGAVIDLGTLGGPNSFAPEAEPQPNNRDEVAGVSDTSTMDQNAAQFCSLFTFLSDPYVCRPFVWRRGVMVELPTLGGNNAVAWQVSNRGQVTGIAQNTTADPTCLSSEPESEPVIWEAGEIQQLPTISGDLDGLALAINDRGQAAGSTGNCDLDIPLTSVHAVLWQRDGHRWTATDLGNLGGTEWNVAFGINKRGQVVGQSGVPGDLAFHAFLWSEGMMTDLGTLPGDVVSWAESINDSGQAVGASFDVNGNPRPVIWEDGVATDLNALIPPDSPWLLLEALNNNDRGQIVTPAFNTMTGESHGLLLTPCGDGDKDCGGNDSKYAVHQTNLTPRKLPNQALLPPWMRAMNRFHRWPH